MRIKMKKFQSKLWAIFSNDNFLLTLKANKQFRPSCFFGGHTHTVVWSRWWCAQMGDEVRTVYNCLLSIREARFYVNNWYLFNIPPRAFTTHTFTLFSLQVLPIRLPISINVIIRRIFALPRGGPHKTYWKSLPIQSTYTKCTQRNENNFFCSFLFLSTLSKFPTSFKLMSSRYWSIVVPLLGLRLLCSCGCLQPPPTWLGTFIHFCQLWRMRSS